jgi:hypothetical protein
VHASLFICKVTAMGPEHAVINPVHRSVTVNPIRLLRTGQLQMAVFFLWHVFC